jgi:hypothetical protein
MSDVLRACLTRQLDSAWKLASYHLDGLTTEECLWRPAPAGLHVHPLADGTFGGEWPQHERYDLGPPSIAWLTWHVGWWWSMTLDHARGESRLTRNPVTWPGDATRVRQWIGELHDQWRELIDQLSDEDLKSTERTRWPFKDRPFTDVLAWLNMELTKNAAEIGYARFLYAVRHATRPETQADVPQRPSQPDS